MPSQVFFFNKRKGCVHAVIYFIFFKHFKLLSNLPVTSCIYNNQASYDDIQSCNQHSGEEADETHCFHALQNLHVPGSIILLHLLILNVFISAYIISLSL